MTELETLRRRRELVVLSAELQRATIVRRFERLEANPARRALGAVALLVRRPALLRAAGALGAFALRTWRRRRALRRTTLQPTPY